MQNFYEDDDMETYDIDDIDTYDDAEDDAEDDLYSKFILSIDTDLMRMEYDRKMYTFMYNNAKVTGKPIKRIDENSVIFDIDKKLKKIKFDLVTLV
jgi:hypothetical protein